MSVSSLSEIQAPQTLRNNEIPIKPTQAKYEFSIFMFDYLYLAYFFFNLVIQQIFQPLMMIK